MTATWSASDSASAWSWVTRTRGRAGRARSASATARRVSSRSPASREENGSSSRTTRGLGGQRPGQRHPLLLAAGQLVRQPRAAPASQPDQVEQLVAPGRRRAAAARGRPKLMLAGDVQVREQRALLGHEADRGGAAAARRGPAPATTRSPSADRAGVRVVEAGDQPQQGGLAAAGRPEHRGQAAARDVEVDPGSTGVAPKDLVRPLTVEGGHAVIDLRASRVSRSARAARCSTISAAYGAAAPYASWRCSPQNCGRQRLRSRSAPAAGSRSAR